MPTTFANIAKTGVAGCCSVYLVAFGLFSLIPGGIMVGSSFNSHFQDDFFKDHIR